MRGKGIKGSVVGFEYVENEEQKGTNGNDGLSFGENKVAVGVGIEEMSCYNVLPSGDIVPF